MLIDSLYDQHQNELLRFARSLTHGKSEAEDLVQETYMKAMTHLHTLNELTTYQQRAWLFKVLRNLFYDRYRKQKVEQPLDGEMGFDIDPGDYTAIEMQELLDALPPKFRDVVYQRYWLGLSSKQIAEPLGLADATVRDRLRTAIHLLKKQINNESF